MLTGESDRFKESPHVGFVNFLFFDKRVPGFIRGLRRHRLFRNIALNVETGGFKFRCYPFQNTHDFQVFRKSLFDYERQNFDFMRRCLKPDSVFVDIGANTGMVSIPFASTVARIIAIEPHPVNVARLKYNAQLNRASNVELLPYAVGPEGTLTLHSVNDGNSGQYSARRTVRLDGKIATSITVQARPLLSLLRERMVTSIDLLKIDVEGFEDEALLPFFREASPSLWPKAVVIEPSQQLWKEDCISFMVGIGYAITGETADNVFLKLRETSAV